MIPNRKVILEITIGLVVMAGSVQADPTVINTCPTVISSPGRYLLGADLICGGGDAITITSSDVTLALEGHTITAGVGAGAAISISGLSGVLVAHVSILGPGLITNGGGNAFSAGVLLLFTVAQSEVNGITVLGSGAGIETFPGGPGNGNAQTGLTFTKNTLGRNGTGINVTNVGSSTISNNDVSGNGVGITILNASILLLTGPPLVVSHNIVNGNTGNGVQLFTGGATLIHSVNVQSNVISGNGGNGIQNSAITEITNNTSLANGMFDLFETAPGCMYFGSGNVVWSGNTFFTANQSCIH